MLKNRALQKELRLLSRLGSEGILEDDYVARQRLSVIVDSLELRLQHSSDIGKEEITSDSPPCLPIVPVGQVSPPAGAHLVLLHLVTAAGVEV